MRPGFTLIAVTGVRAVGLDAKGDEPCFLRRGDAKFDRLAEGVRGGLAPPKRLRFVTKNLAVVKRPARLSFIPFNGIGIAVMLDNFSNGVAV
jgi:hypothetical protein